MWRPQWRFRRDSGKFKLRLKVRAGSDSQTVASGQRTEGGGVAVGMRIKMKIRKNWIRNGRRKVETVVGSRESVVGYLAVP